MPVFAPRTVAIATVCSGAILFSMQSAQAIEGSWYVGAGAGISRLTPDVQGSNFTLEDDGSVAKGLYLGLDITDWISAEVAATDLGEAELSGGQTIEYSALSIGGVAYVWGARDVRIRQEALSAYVRFGFNRIDNQSGIALDEADNTALWLGAGLQWPLGSRWGVRGELASFDGDAQTVMASLYWRQQKESGATQSRPAERQPPVQPSVVDKPAPRVNKPTPSVEPESVEAPVTEPVTAPITDPIPRVTAPDPVIADGDPCTVPVPGEPADANGCAVFSGVLKGVQFEGDSTTLTSIGQQLLNRMADSLKRYPDTVVEIRVHTQAYPEVNRARNLSRERAISVARYLASQGVSVKRLRARAFGSSQPRGDNDTAGGRRINNRVELRVL